ncbi:MAG TPA: penicillin-binding protein 2 [Clostridia bacterium]|nr:penicillin-binding protein 2 [Clostridia bacterium]
MTDKQIRHKLKVLSIGLLIVFAILSLRLFSLQLIHTDTYQTLARENRMRLIPISPPRGHILDRNKVKIVGNRPVYTVSLMPGKIENADRLIKDLSGVLDIDESEIAERIMEQEGRPFEPIRIAVDVPIEVVTKIEESRAYLPDVFIDIEPVRDYPNGSMMSQTLGYVRQIYKEQLGPLRDQGYQMGDMYGQEGLENVFDGQLRGEKGARQVEVDVFSHPVNYLGIKEASPGNDLVLTIDSKVQMAAEEGLLDALDKSRSLNYKDANAGALVALDVNTGAVLAMASIPNYDPGIFAGSLSQKDWDDLQKSKAQINRALGLYPPGSTFKMVVATAGLEENKITPDFSVNCRGYYMLGSTRFNDWKPGGHGRTSLLKAIQQSCNVYFWNVALMVGPEKISEYAQKLGLGAKTGIELKGEESVPVPDPAWKENIVKASLDSSYGPKFKDLDDSYNALLVRAGDQEARERIKAEWVEAKSELQKEYDSNEWWWTWHTFDTLNTAIGQGDNRYSPLQLASYVATIANGGDRYRPFLVREILSPEGETIEKFKPYVIEKTGINSQTLEVIREGMLLVTKPEGTAAGAFWGFPVNVAGKSGTSEVDKKDNHSLFVAFAPYEKPEIAVAAIIEYGGGGSAIAAYAVRDTIAAYFDLVNVDGNWVIESETDS